MARQALKIMLGVPILTLFAVYIYAICVFYGLLFLLVL